MRRHARSGSSSSTMSIRLPRTSTQGASAQSVCGGSNIVETELLFSTICLTSSSYCRRFNWLQHVIGCALFIMFGCHGCGNRLAMNSELLRSHRNIITHKLNHMPDVAILDFVQQQDVFL